MWSEYLKTQQRTEEEKWEFMKMSARLFYQVRTIGQKPTNLKWLIIKVTDKLLLCKLFFFFLVALVRANKALGDLLWGISIAGKLRSFSGDWDENISLSRNVLSRGRFVTPAAEIAQCVICRLCWLYLSWVAVFVMAVDCKQSLCQIYVSKMQYQAQASKQILVRLFGPAFWECGAVLNGLIAAQIWVVR